MTTTPPTPSRTSLGNKLSPPRHLPEKLIRRDLLLEEVKHLQAHRKKAILIEARAGSGKTVFTQQYIHQSNFPAGWYQLGTEDHDPVALLNVLVSLLQQELPNFRSENVADALAQGIVHYREIIQFGELLAKEITESCCHGFHLVLDDFHLLEGAPDSTALITTLIKNTPSWMQWVLVSRHSVRKVLNARQLGLPALIIGDDELDFSLNETACLFQNGFAITLPFDQARRYQSLTEGWVTGLVLCAMQSQRKRKSGENDEVSFDLHELQEHLSDYFLQDALADFSKVQIEEVLQMVLLEDLPGGLLIRLFGQDRAEAIVRKMQESNRFFRFLDDTKNIYSFHHLFRDSLLPVAVEQLPEQMHHDVGLKAAQYHLENNEPLRALHYAVRNKNTQLCEIILQDFGHELLHRNQIKTLHRLLDHFPPPTLSELPWLSFYYGVCLQDSEPAKALPFLTQAQHIFSEQNNDIGLLAANSQLIEYHTIIDGQYNHMARYVEELDEIFSRKCNQLPITLKLRIAYSLAMGFCFLQSDMEKVRHYDTLALEISTQNRLDNMIAMSRMIRAYRFGFIGNWTGCKNEIEASLPLLDNPRVTTLTKLFLKVLQINLLEMVGDFINYRHQKRALEQLSEHDAVSQSIIGPFIHIWDIDSALAENSFEAAGGTVNAGLQEAYAASKAHMRSQLLHYQAVILALNNEKAKSLDAIRESLSLRQEAGGKAFILLNRTILGKAYALLGMAEEAENLFAEALQLSYQLREEFQRAGIFAHRAWLRLQTGQEAHALEDIEQCLQCMRRNNYKHFFSLMPKTMLPVLQLAINNNIETGFATWLLSEQLHTGVTKKGDFVPLLEIRLLSDWTITTQDGCSLSLHDLTQNERLLLFSLIERPDNLLDRNTLSEQLWPKKSEPKQRTSLDVLISHLRKKLGNLVSPENAREHLNVDLGSIRLQHCCIDVQQFINYARQANIHLEKNEVWQAANNFHLAFRLWGEKGLEGLQWGNNGAFYATVENTYLQAAKSWSPLLEKQGKSNEACQLLERAFKQMPLDRDLARQLYNFHVATRNHSEAQRVVQLYQQAFQDAGYDPLDVETEEFDFWGNG